MPGLRSLVKRSLGLQVARLRVVTFVVFGFSADLVQNCSNLFLCNMAAEAVMWIWRRRCEFAVVLKHDDFERRPLKTICYARRKKLFFWKLSVVGADEFGWLWQVGNVGYCARRGQAWREFHRHEINFRGWHNSGAVWQWHLSIPSSGIAAATAVLSDFTHDFIRKSVIPHCRYSHVWQCEKWYIPHLTDVGKKRIGGSADVLTWLCWS